jgi:hypothetical protein
MNFSLTRLIPRSHRAFLYLSAVIIGLLCFSQQANADALYQQKIFIPENSGAGLKAAAQDAAQALQKMTGKEFAVSSEYSGPGISLLRSDAPQAPADATKWLADKGQEPFVIRSNDDRTLSVIANGDAGLQHGLYFYLEGLGVRYYFPNENWTIIPRRQDITLKINRQMAPDFKIRNFFGTGGFGSPNKIDPKLEIKARWEQWKNRNLMGGEYSLGGHSGEAFNLEKKAILLEHPEYLANINGKYVPWSLTAKLNTANPDAVKLYVDWTVARFRKMRAANPHAFAVSVDPSDGGGHCNSDECKQIGNGSASDQVFYIANEAAKAVRAEFPDGWVNLYGYNEHAIPPSFPLEPNVYVSIIPYAFQTTGLSPEEFIKVWGKKVSRMSIYDYWSIPDWTHDMPSFNYLSTPASKLKLWHENNIEGFSSESTYSAGAMGIGWYLAAHQMWDLKTDQNAVLNDFYDTAFGAARPPMQRMLERWATSFKLTGYELAWSYRDLQEALKLAKTPEVKARLADYGRYLEYLRLTLQSQNVPKEERAAAQSALVDYIWDIYPSAMIHSLREYQLETRGDEATRALYTGKDARGWEAVAPPTDEEVVAAIAAGVKKYPPLDFTPHKYSGALVPLPAAPPALEGDKLPSLFLVGPTTLQLEARPGQSTLPLKINGEARVQLKDMDGKVLFDHEVEPNGDWESFKKAESLQELSIPLPKSGRYQLVLRRAKNATTHLQFPRDFLITLQAFRTGKPMASPRLYFYVPKGLKTVAMYMPDVVRVNRFFDSKGEKVEPTVHDGGHVYVVPVPVGEDGKVWSMDNIVSPNYSPEMLNAPQAFALYPNALLVPEDAL